MSRRKIRKGSTVVLIQGEYNEMSNVCVLRARHEIDCAAVVAEFREAHKGQGKTLDAFPDWFVGRGYGEEVRFEDWHYADHFDFME